LPLTIPNRVEAPDWLPDGSGFVYRNLKDPQDPYSGQVMFHRLGTAVADDVVLLRQYTLAENEALATTWGPGGSLSRDGRTLQLGYYTSTSSNDLWVADFEQFLKTGKLEKREISVGQVGIITGTAVGGQFFVRTTQGAPNGRVDRIDLASMKRTVLVPERSDAAIQNVSVADGVVVVEYLDKASSAFDLFDFAGKRLGRLALPGIGSGELAAEVDSTEGFLSFTSYNYPPTIFRVDLRNAKARPEVWERPAVPVDPSTVEVRQVWYPSKDGTRVSMFIVHRKGLKLDGARPTILYGYGGFNLSETPRFSATLFPWFEDGGVYAVANLRGGGEYGDAWHEAGMLARKQNVFDDFIAAGEWLKANGYTRRDRLAIRGGSNGGLLVGAALTQRPELFRAVVAQVAILDMLRFELDPNGEFNVTEFGSVKDPEQFRALAAYSPYQQVRAGVKYPAVFLWTGENDGRVNPMNSRKMAARLQAATASGRPIYLMTTGAAGHGIGSPLSVQIDQAADYLAFLFDQLGMTLP
jgi:prolyl oligopeptidase